jgi:WD40 repeat protein
MISSRPFRVYPVGIALFLLVISAPHSMAEPPAKVDSFGDKLPARAVARFGTVAYRAPGLAGLGFRPTGELVAISEDLRLHVWPADGSPRETAVNLVDSPEYGWRRALAANAVRAAAYKDRKLIVWDLRGDKPTVELERDANDVHGLRFSPDGKWLAVNVTGRNVKERLSICDIERKHWIDLVIPGEYVNSLSFTPNGRQLAYIASYQIFVVESATGREILRTKPPIGNPDSVGFSPDGSRIAVSYVHFSTSSNPPVHVLNAIDGTPVLKIDIGDESARWVAYSADGKRIRTGGRFGLKEWDAETGKAIRTLSGPAEKAAVDSADGRWIASCNGEAVMIRDRATGMPIRPRADGSGGHLEAVMGITISPDGKVAATDALDGEIRLWNVETAKEVARIRSTWGNEPRVAFLPDSRSFLAVAPDGATPVEFDAVTGRELRRFAVPDGTTKREMTRNLRLSSDGKVLTTTSEPRTTAMKTYEVRWDVVAGAELDRKELTRSPIESIMPTVRSPDGKWTSHSGMLFKAGDPKPIRIVPQTAHSMISHFSADGRHVLCSCLERVATVNASRREFIAVFDLIEQHNAFELPTGNAMSIALSPDDRLLAIVGKTKVSVWEMATGKPVISEDNVRGNVMRPRAVAWSRDGRTLFAGQDTAVLAWNMAGPRRAASVPPADAATVARWWKSLAEVEASAAQAAMWELADRPALTLKLIRDRTEVDANEIATIKGLLAKLVAASFEEREAATKRLKAFGERAEPILRDAAKSETSVEKAERIAKILTSVRRFILEEGDTLRDVRAVTVLERIGNADARARLAAIAKGTPETRSVIEAKSALNRLVPVR